MDNEPKINSSKNAIKSANEQLDNSQDNNKDYRSILFSFQKLFNFIGLINSPGELIKKACDALIDTKLFNSTWAALFDENRKISTTYEIGIGKDFVTILQEIEKGNIPACGQWAIQFVNGSYTYCNNPDCRNCSLGRKTMEKEKLAIRLQYHNKLYGFICLSLYSEIIFEEVDLLMLKNFSIQLSLALQVLHTEQNSKLLSRQFQTVDKKYNSLLENMVNGFALHKIIWDRDNVTFDYEFIDVNPKFQEYTGLKREDLIGKTLSNVFPVAKGPGFDWIQTYYDVALTGKEINFELYSEAFKRWLFISSFPLKNNYFATILSDITARKKAEDEILKFKNELEVLVFKRTQELKSVNEELEAFAYSVSHDLRAPLRHVMGFLELLKERSSEQLDETGLRYLGNIRESAIKMNQLIDELLNFSRSNQVPLQKFSFDLFQLVKEVYMEITESSPEEKVIFNISPIPEVYGDQILIRQVVVNLISNALKFSTKNEVAKIEVGSTTKNGEVIVFVKDNGVGFDMKYSHRLFGVFQRLHSEDDFKGTGIGLALVKRIITRHGGRTWAEAEVNNGATFYFSLPTKKE